MKQTICLYSCLKIWYLPAQTESDNKAFFPCLSTWHISHCYSNIAAKHLMSDPAKMKGERNEAVYTEGMHVILSDERDGIPLHQAFGEKPSSYVNKISHRGVKLLGAGTVSITLKETQCSLFIFVGWQSGWLSNKGKSVRPCEIIIKQRTTHLAQCSQCMNAGGEQVCPTDLTSKLRQYN